MWRTITTALRLVKSHARILCLMLSAAIECGSNTVIDPRGSGTTQAAFVEVNPDLLVVVIKITIYSYHEKLVHQIFSSCIFEFSCNKSILQWVQTLQMSNENLKKDAM